MNTYIVLNVENQMIIKYEFKLYPNIVCDDKKQLWQLEHFRNKRTYPTKKLTYNEDRKAFRIRSQWVSRKRLLKLKIEVDVFKDIPEFSVLNKLINDLKTVSNETKDTTNNTSNNINSNMHSNNVLFNNSLKTI